MKVAPPVPTLEPFTCHWYEGFVPPFVGVAVNVFDAPAHDGLVPVVCAIATLAVVAQVAS